MTNECGAASPDHQNTFIPRRSAIELFPFFPANFLSSLSELIGNCSLRGCQENCGITPAGPECYCKSGYEIGPDEKACKGEAWIG